MILLSKSTSQSAYASSCKFAEKSELFHWTSAYKKSFENTLPHQLASFVKMALLFHEQSHSFSSQASDSLLNTARISTTQWKRNLDRVWSRTACDHHFLIHQQIPFRNVLFRILSSGINWVLETRVPGQGISEEHSSGFKISALCVFHVSGVANASFKLNWYSYSCKIPYNSMFFYSGCKQLP